MRGTWCSVLLSPGAGRGELRGGPGGPGGRPGGSRAGGRAGLGAWLGRLAPRLGLLGRRGRAGTQAHTFPRLLLPGAQRSDPDPDPDPVMRMSSSPAGSGDTGLSRPDPAGPLPASQVPSSCRRGSGHPHPSAQGHRPFRCPRTHARHHARQSSTPGVRLTPSSCSAPTPSWSLPTEEHVLPLPRPRRPRLLRGAILHQAVSAHGAFLLEKPPRPRWEVGRGRGRDYI